MLANTDLRKDDIITTFSGETVDDKPHDGEYVIQLNDGSYPTDRR